jgi:hypothetical protein
MCFLYRPPLKFDDIDNTRPTVAEDAVEGVPEPLQVGAAEMVNRNEVSVAPARSRDS